MSIASAASLEDYELLSTYERDNGVVLGFNVRYFRNELLRRWTHIQDTTRLGRDTTYLEIWFRAEIRSTMYNNADRHWIRELTGLSSEECHIVGST